MKFSEFQHILSEERLLRYLLACGNDSRKTYRLNLNLTQEVFTLLSCFEVTVRNSIGRILPYGLDHVQQVCSKINNLKGKKNE